MPSQPQSSGGERLAAARAATRVEPIALFAVAFLGVLWAVWAWRDGAYFEDVLMPGTIMLCIGLVLFAIGAPMRIELRLSLPAAIGFGALIALAAWTATSALWSPAPDIAVADGVRVGVYAIGFGAGLWIANLLGPRMGLCLVPLALAGGFVGILAALGLAFGDSPSELLEADGTLDYPLGYRNATAAFFALAVFPALGLAAERSLDWRLRGLAQATASLCFGLFLLCQSRGALLGFLAAGVAYLMLSPLRVRALCWMALSLLPGLAVIPPALDLFQATTDRGLDLALAEMHAAGVAVLAVSIVVLVLGAAAARWEGRVPGLGSGSATGNAVVARGLAGVAAIGAVAFVVSVGNPIDWIGERFDEFREGGSGDLAAEPSRFSFDAGSDRRDLWRVALEQAADDPIFGTGGGGYGYAYLREREVSHQNALDAHSVELEVLSELGVPGLALLLAAIGGAAIGSLRARRLGPSAAALGAAALACGTYWLVHGSIDWLWTYPAICAPVFALLGAACSPPLRSMRALSNRSARRGACCAAALLIVVAVPIFFADRYLDRAYSGWRQDLGEAYADLDRASALNPLSDSPLLAEGAIARAAGDEERALIAFRKASEKRPEEWAAHYLVADLLASRNRLLARNELLVALELNPLSKRIRPLARELGIDPAASPTPGG